MQDVDNGGDSMAWGIWDMAIPSAQFCYEPKLL